MEAAKPSLTIAPRRSRAVEWLKLRRMDGVLFGAAVGLIAFSVFTLATSTRDEIAGRPLFFVERQSLYAVIGIALMIALSRIDYTRLRDLRVTIYVAMVGSIALVLLVGTAVRGSNRWIDLPFFQFQPSELAKVLLCVSLAAFVYERVRRPFGLRQTVGLLALGLFPAVLVFLQPDLGTGIVLVAIALTILFVAGIPWQHFAAIGAAVVLIGAGVYAAGSAAGVHFLHGYQQDRLTAFLHPSDDPSDASYQVNQAVIAVGSGEEVGRGNDATQTELLFLPERHTDFIYAVIGERFGFLGCRVRRLPLRRPLLARDPSDEDLEELLRDDDRRRGGRDARLPGDRQHRDEPRADARHRDHASADELRRLVGARHLPGARRAAEHPCRRACADCRGNSFSPR